MTAVVFTAVVCGLFVWSVAHKPSPTVARLRGLRGRPFSYVDAHAGGGLYDLRSEEAQVFCNFQVGGALADRVTFGNATRQPPAKVRVGQWGRKWTPEIELQDGQK